MAKPSALTDENIEKVALLLEHTEGGRSRMSVPEIQELLGVSAPTISRLKALAVERGLLRLQCRLSDERREQLQQLLQSGRGDLRARLHAWGGEKAEHLLGIEIIDAQLRVRASDESPVEIEDSLEKFSSAAAEVLFDRVIPHARSIGVTWGLAIEMVTTQLVALLGQSGSRGSCDVFPVAGDSKQVSLRPEESATLIAAKLDKALNGREDYEYSLTGVAAAFPKLTGSKEARDKKVSVIKEYFRVVSSYGAIFDQGCLLDPADTILTGVGTIDPLNDPQLEADRLELLEKATVGNIGGIFVLRPGISEALAERVAEFQGAWTGMNHSHILSCAQRAHEAAQAAGDDPQAERSPGVVVMSMGDTERIVAHAVREGLVSRLVIDQVLAGRLSRYIAGESVPWPRIVK